MAHQSAKFTSQLERKEYLKWIYELEYNVHRIPKEDIVIYLHVPWKVGLSLSSKKGTRKYLKGKDDIAEKDIVHRKQTEKMYLSLSKKYKHWKVIDCMKKKKLLSRKEVHQSILKIVEL